MVPFTSCTAYDLFSHAIRDNFPHTFLNGLPVFIGRKVAEHRTIFPTRQHFHHKLKFEHVIWPKPNKSATRGNKPG